MVGRGLSVLLVGCQRLLCGFMEVWSGSIWEGLWSETAAAKNYVSDRSTLREMAKDPKGVINRLAQFTVSAKDEVQVLCDKYFVGDRVPTELIQVMSNISEELDHVSRFQDMLLEQKAEVQEAAAMWEGLVNAFVENERYVSGLTQQKWAKVPCEHIVGDIWECYLEACTP